jgi:hypothetical protein
MTAGIKRLSSLSYFLPGLAFRNDGYKMSYKKFRLDINGLRAFAVLSVVLYHFGVPYVSGGFTGVDVFS